MVFISETSDSTLDILDLIRVSSVDETPDELLVGALCRGCMVIWLEKKVTKVLFISRESLVIWVSALFCQFLKPLTSMEQGFLEKAAKCQKFKKKSKKLIPKTPKVANVILCSCKSCSKSLIPKILFNCSCVLGLCLISCKQVVLS